MTDLASLASANAISLEVKKYGLQQRQSGDWMLRLVFSANDYSDALGRAAMGARFACVMVEISDDETPVRHDAEDRDKWRSLGPAKQAGIRCKDPVFWAFLRESAYHYSDVRSEESAARAVREICMVLTRSDLGKAGFSDQRILWFDLDQKFLAWKARENA